MRKIFTLFAAFFVANVAMATDYTDELTVTVNGESMTQTSTISVEQQQNGKYTLSLNNFTLGSDMPVGNIVLADITGENVGNVVILRTKQNITIANGTDTSVETWFGPLLGEVPIDMVAAIKGADLRTVINIDMSSTLGQTINVQFGSGYQLPNSGFEEFHEASTGNVEPNAWHSFGSATGKFKSITKNSTSKSEDVRDGASGSYCVKISSSSIFGIIANGTMTTGRLNAGATSATSTDNHSSLDLTVTDTDGNGDPFYTLMKGKPDYLEVWVRFKQGTPQATYKYATVSAAITDGTYYQEPMDKTYTNILAVAQDKEIETCDFAWQRLDIPFKYDSYRDNNVEGKAILVTVSTNAEPGKGSNGDELYVDDIAMVYNGDLTTLKVKGENVSGFAYDVYEYDVTASGTVTAADIDTGSNGEGAYILKSVTSDSNGKKAEVTVISNDLSSVKTYTLNISDDTTAITNIGNDANATVESVYNAAGQQISTPSRGLNIIRYSDGKVVKQIKR